ncbi:bifunctional 3'-5' exonuclease/ATP-dependent helicase WRN isoform X2 [Tribolium castaneum]|uniref:ATP-dependent DNA helicase n=1 Tax=Tribolium castaneum TaxID=7070 RepID=D6X0E5_TRICA|nr:PREDICTED: Werner syndrome ATP-dependent helicase isoform X2 [Tribolium castaneum]EFA09584.2 Bloom syndrome protein homolog-like Protein [Tribolium castaneum]|eukprot:XP_008198401.1 PREDICTED: Werner syndrome ATP-dependent helicase isoform X2 [Tribolium castaneum]
MDFEFDEIDSKALEDLMETVTKTSAKSGPSPEHLKVLTKFFGHKTFRPKQWEIIFAIMDKRDVCAIMSTGYGKSLCFQYPSTFLKGVTLVVSPLIALMQDQVLALTVSNIPACLLGSAQNEQRKVIEDILQNKYSIVYITPEFCSGDLGLELLKKMAQQLKIVLIAIDEAHCISSWGHDFRSQYRNLGNLRQIFPRVPVIAVTATATTRVRGDIVKSLQLRDPLIVCSGFDRPNLYFEVYQRAGGGAFKDLTKAMVYEKSEWKFSGPTIIYCITRRQTEDLCEILKNCGVRCRVYHAGLSQKERQEAHEEFVRDKVDVIVATIAFGMGIDKPDIRNVIHYGSSNSVESYYQEVGRAGRDGLPARCVTIYSSGDFQILRNISGGSVKKETALRQIEDYLTTRKCRRRFILEFFEDEVGEDKPKQRCCDVCTQKLYDNRTDQEKYEGLDEKGRYDFTEDAKKFLKTVALFGGKCGLTTYILFLRGSQSTRLTEDKRKHPLNGCGKDQSEEWWKCIAKILTAENCLSEKNQKLSSGFTYQALSLTNKGQSMINGSEKLLIPPPSTVLTLLKQKPAKESVWLTTRPVNTPSTSKQPENTETPEEIEQRMSLYRKLLDQRTDIAAKLDCMPYMVASNTVLMEMSKCKPKTIADLRTLNLEGFPEAKILKFGAAFLGVIARQLKLNKPKIREILLQNPLPDVSMTVTAEVSCSMLESGLTVGEIAAKRGVTVGTIASHLISGIKFGFPVKMSELGVSEEHRDAIIKAYRGLVGPPLSPVLGFNSVRLSEMKERCPPDFTFDQIKTVLAYLEVRCHLAALNFDYEEFEDFNFSDVDLKTEMKSEEEGPPLKREKKDCDPCVDAILDSPPREVKAEPKKSKKALPPWLVPKKLS